MNIFIAKLSRNTTADDLIKLFEPFGEVVTAKIIIDRMTGASKGYGFVEMAEEEAGDQAISSLNETTFMESEIVVKKAHPREERTPQRRTVLKRNSTEHSTDYSDEAPNHAEPEELPEAE